MNYKFKTEIELKKKRNKKIVLGTIEQILKEYEIKDILINEDSLEFVNESTFWHGPTEYLAYITKGKFSIIDDGNKTKILYESYTPITTIIIILLAFILSGIFFDFSIMIVGILIFLISLAISYLTIRSVERGISDKIIERTL